MNMFCFQCQEAVGNKGCTVAGACGKGPETSAYQDLLIYTLKGNALLAQGLQSAGPRERASRLATEALFATITNANFDDDRMKGYILRNLDLRAELTAAMWREQARLGDAPHPSQPGGANAGGCILIPDCPANPACL